MAQPYITWSDVRSVLATIDDFDLKIPLNEESFVASTQDTLSNCGYIARLYRDGTDLGAAQATAVAVDSDGEWHYESSTDLLTTFNTNDPDSYEWMAAPDTLANVQAKFMNTGAEMFEGVNPRFPRPLPKSDRSYSGAEYEAGIVKGVALFAAREAIINSDPGSPELFKVENQLWNEQETGLIDLIKKGELKFEFELTDSDEHGEIVEGTLNAATTGYPTETFGDATVPYAKVKASIVTGGTVTYGTANTTVTYQVTDGDGTALVSATLLDIDAIQPVGHGVSISWAAGVYTANDFWYIYIRNHSTSSSIVSSFNLSRV
jgi:hypothetical protein